jgi:GT2 family glycosyltransferase
MIFIIIPVFNRKRFTRNCLISLSSQTYKDYKVIVVDDGSTDGTSEMIASEFSKVHMLKGDGTLWWAGATNKGIEFVLKDFNHRQEDYILTLNNDLELPENYLETLISTASVYPKAILGSVSVNINKPDEMNFCGISWNEFTGKYYLKAKDYNCSYQNLLEKRKVIDSDMLPGRGTLIPMTIFDEVGMYDSKNFPQYAADEDFSLRARKKGWQLLIPTNVFVKSHIDQTGTDVENLRFGFRTYKNLFFSIKSPLNLKIRYRWAIKNTRLKLIYFLFESTKIFISVSFKMIRGISNT